MKRTILRAFLALSMVLIAPAANAQTNQPAPPIPEEARKHFIMGTTLFKDAKTPGDYAQVESQFKQAVDLAPQWPDPRYNLALTKEAAGDYAGAMADLKIYLQFKLSDTEARTAQDKIYALEAKQQKIEDAANSPAGRFASFLKSLDGGVWRCSRNYGNNYDGSYFDSNVSIEFLAITGNQISDTLNRVFTNSSQRQYLTHAPYDPSVHSSWTATLTSHEFSAPNQGTPNQHQDFTISDDGKTITEHISVQYPGGLSKSTAIFDRIK